jgi:hypothetical protein
MEKQLKKYEKLFGYDYDIVQDTDSNTYSLYYYPEGTWGNECTRTCFEGLSSEEANKFIEAMTLAFDIAIEAQMGVPLRLAKTFDKSYMDAMTMQELEIKATPKGEDCNTYMIKKLFDKKYNN